MFSNRYHCDELPLHKIRRLLGCGLYFLLLHFQSYDSKKKILVDVPDFTRKVLCGETENHGSLFLGLGKIGVFAQKPWEKQCQVQMQDSP